MQKLKIVIIGAGSASFGMSCLMDAFTTKELWGSELFLVDIDVIALEKVVSAAQRINMEIGACYSIFCSTDRREALPGADFIITSIAINRDALWQHDFRIPNKYGIKHVLGENGGPGAVFHTMRNLPVILDICKDIEAICPDALLINFTNPESRICLAISKYTRVKAIGLCHQLYEGIRNVSHIMGIEPDALDVKAAGLNHFSWFISITDKNTFEDLYPTLYNKEKEMPCEYEKLSRFMYEKFGLFPTSGDVHLGEYIPYAHEMISTQGYDFDKAAISRIKQNKILENIGNENIPFDYENLKPSGEKAFTIIKGIAFNTNELIDAVNLPNYGLISNLPQNAIVEVPAVASKSGIRGLCMGELPAGIAALCLNQISVQNMVVDAGVKGDQGLVLQALLIDPNVSSAVIAQKIFDELYEINKPYLPQF